MTRVSLIGFVLLTVCLCIGTIVLSLNWQMAETLSSHLDATDAFFGLLFLIFTLSAASYERN